MKVVLISTYELGHQPFGLASPVAWLRARGVQVTSLDLSREAFREDVVRDADALAFYVPMHTATRLAVPLIERVRQLNPEAALCFYGLYAPVNKAYLQELGVERIVGGEFEQELADWIESLARRASNDATSEGQSQSRIVANAASDEMAERPTISLERLRFVVPDRSELPALRQYAHLLMPDGGYRVSGYTEASRGCKHLCRHCPIVPVYNGIFRVVPREVVLEDIRRQVQAGAEHITFGDPDFFNGPAHALAIVAAMHDEFPGLSFDATIKIEHLRKHAEHLNTLREAGCLFITTAVESVDDAILERLDKGHTSADFLAVAAHFRELDLALQPTFVPFTPWSTLAGYRELLTILAEQELIENVAPIQLGIRLLIPQGSRILELDDLRQMVGAFDPAALSYPWKHPDSRMDALAERIQDLATAGDTLKWSRTETFQRIWNAAAEADSAEVIPVPRRLGAAAAVRAIPHFTEPWYCCAEPTRQQFVAIGAAVQQNLPDTTSAAAVAEAAARAAARADAFL